MVQQKQICLQGSVRYGQHLELRLAAPLQGARGDVLSPPGSLRQVTSLTHRVSHLFCWNESPSRGLASIVLSRCLKLLSHLICLSDAPVLGNKTNKVVKTLSRYFKTSTERTPCPNLIMADDPYFSGGSWKSVIEAFVFDS